MHSEINVCWRKDRGGISVSPSRQGNIKMAKNEEDVLERGNINFAKDNMMFVLKEIRFERGIN